MTGSNCALLYVRVVPAVAAAVCCLFFLVFRVVRIAMGAGNSERNYLLLIATMAITRY